MDDEVTKAAEAGETPPKPKKPKMMNVYNASMQGQKIHLGKGITIKPGQSGKVPYAYGKKLVDSCRWVQRAERGDVME